LNTQPESTKRLPEANEFSPGQIKLRSVLDLATEHAGDRESLVEAIRQTFFSSAASRRTDEAARLTQQRTRANNVLIGMKGYGLFDLSQSRLTPAGEGLARVQGDELLATTFAEHILKTPWNIEVLEAVRTLQAQGRRPSKATLQRELESRGFKLPRATTHHTKLLQWLREAGVIDADYEIDQELVAELLGISLTTLGEWESLTREQRTFLKTLRRLADTYGASPLPARDVVSQAKIEHGPIFREDQLAGRVFKPLIEHGWIEQDIAPGGRGGKSGRVAPTAKLLDLTLELLPEGDEWGVPPDLRLKLETPIESIIADLAHESTHIKGVALELLALRLAVDSGLTPLRFRLRAAETGGAEVDLVAEGAQLHFARWLFQCKNTKTVSLADLAKEVGMAVMLRAHVIVLVTTGRFASSVQTYAREVMETQPLQVILIDKKIIASYQNGGTGSLMTFLHETAEATMRLKRTQIERPLAFGEI
jgi:transcriptional regulator with XRE-family HTH domain